MNWQNVTVKLSDLQPWEHNPRTMTKKQAQRLLKSWQELGQFQTIAIGPSDNGSGHPVYDGHQRLSALLVAYGAQYAIDARQSDRALTEDERRYLITQANLPVGAWRFEEIAGWPEAQEWGFDAEMLQTWNSDAAALATMLEAEQPAGDADAEPQIDRAAELNEKWQVQRGDLWRIGAHRLLCGDSTKREDVERVMQGEKADMVFTDPPYNVDYDGDTSVGESLVRAGLRKSGSLRPIQNDAMGEEDWCVFQSRWLEQTLSVLEGAVYICMSAKEWASTRVAFQAAGGHWSSDIVWVKDRFVLGRKNYHSRYEAMLYGWVEGKEHHWCGARDKDDVWEIKRNATNDLHPTMKPAELVERAMGDSSRIDADVYDPFAGSGTTLVACQNLQRKCRAIEISPNYCAVILERMATAFPGIEIERISEAVLTS